MSILEHLDQLVSAPSKGIDSLREDVLAGRATAGEYAQATFKEVDGEGSQENSFAANPASPFQDFWGMLSNMVQGRKRYNDQEMAALGIDNDFIADQEGFETTGYVPNSGKSGVTVSSGVDLGQMNEADLRGLGLASPLADRLKPYLGAKRDEAQSVLRQKPLRLTEGEAYDLDLAFKKKQARQLRNKWEKSSGQSWDDLTPYQRTVLYSVAHQYGTDLESATPKFWQAATTGDWRGVLKELRDFGDSYKSRRNREADYLQAGLRNNSKRMFK